MFKRTMSALAIAAIAYVGVATAQESATVTLRSGERISGQLIDLGGVGFTMKVNNEERRIPKNDVAVIDFTGGTMTEADWNKVNAGKNMIWLRNGETVTGELYDISGTTPLKITLNTDSGQRELNSSEIGRIVLAKTDAATAATSGKTSATPGTASGAGGAIVVAGNQQWTNTGLMVRKGEVLMFNSTGEVAIRDAAQEMAKPAGVTTGAMAGQGAPLPNVLTGALIARIGNGEPFGIGDQTSIPMPATGQLYLGVNDANVADNTGEFRVEISRATRNRR